MSILDLLEPIYSRLPEVRPPEVQPPLKKKLMWGGVALLLFFIMGNITVIGLEQSRLGELEALQVILASRIGTLITIGIGPIVLASIILQLLVGGGILNIDLSNPKDKARFTSMQKLFAIVLCFFEAAVYVFSGFLTPAPGMFHWIILQVAFGSIALLYLDEVVSKYGVGSGIGLFIAGGVAGSIFWIIFNPLSATGELAFLGGQGLIYLFIQNISDVYNSVNLYLLPIIFSIVVFFVVIFAEGMHVNIPITMGRRGTGGRFPVKFLYVSNIPVILAVALFANISLWAAILANIPFLGVLLEKIASVVIPPYNLRQNLIAQLPFLDLGNVAVDAINSIMIFFNPLSASTPFGAAATETIGAGLIHALLYIIILTGFCIVFGKFWVEMAGQGPEAISNQLQRSGMYIPGFRRDPRIIRKILERYIPPISILGSAFVGLLAAFSDLTGAVGSGIGILLTVGIVYRLYEELARLQLLEMHPMLGRLLG